jgi:regulator of sirC expression with transglutaminase-like and TPR domain
LHIQQTALKFDPPSPLAYFAALVADDHGLPLFEAAVAVAHVEDPALDTQAVLAQVDGLARTLARRLAADAPALQRLRLLNHFFFEELGFGGNVNDYYDRRNSYLPHVLSTRRGIPITLALIYLELATQVGLKAHGVSFPGHFLVKFDLPRGEVVIDPFSGHSLSREQLEERLAPYRQRHAQMLGGMELPLALFLRSASPRETLARLLRNLKEIHRGAGDVDRLVPVLQRLTVLLPEAWEEQRDLALAWAQQGRLADAQSAMALYVAHRPEADDASAMRSAQLMWARQAGLGPLLH